MDTQRLKIGKRYEIWGIVLLVFAIYFGIEIAATGGFAMIPTKKILMMRTVIFGWRLWMLLIPDALSAWIGAALLGEGQYLRNHHGLPFGTQDLKRFLSRKY